MARMNSYYFLVIVTVPLALVYLFLHSSMWNNNGILAEKKESGEVERKLAEANENWLKGVENRKNLESLNRFSDDFPWEFFGGISMWDFFYPNFDCPYSVERIGRSGDGGKWVCGLRKIAKRRNNCVIYSYGVSYDISFEQELAERTNCSIYLFDHTIDTNSIELPQQYPGRVFIEKMGIGVNDTSNVRSIQSTMKKYNHDFIDILKIDVEGTEFKIFDNIRKDFPGGLPFGQLQMEIHLPDKGEKKFFKTYIKWLKNLEEMGFRAFRNEINLFNAKLSRKGIPNLSEYSFLNVKYDNYLLHS